MFKTVSIAALCLAIALGGVAFFFHNQAKSLKAQNQSLSRSLAAMEEQAAQSAEARKVEAERARLWRERAAKLDASINALFNEEIEDVPLDPRIIAYLDSLRAE